MSRIQDILNKAEREGAVRRTRGLGDDGGRRRRAASAAAPPRRRRGADAGAPPSERRTGGRADRLGVAPPTPRGDARPSARGRAGSAVARR